ncbi:hypothetical protein [Neorhizobium galegae]|uniref:hypothetical protein n=1 Tax=Neorhizobium galegae TaxID=399 RepID=UPI002107F74A|nr:hypothetical protein [Neorhizobium galegae]MCQ1835174.1 hypothetical protein [Neorhizobium galegae]
MSSNNGGGGFFALLLILAFLSAFVSLILVALAYALMGAGVVVGFIAFAWTLVCLMAWNNSFCLGNIYVDSDDARAFILRGVFGAVVLPIFLVLADTFFNVAVNWNYLHYYVASGYALLSVGLEYLFAKRADIPYVSYDHMPRHHQQQQLLLPPETPAPKSLPSPEPFRFARWDDEERS